MVEVREGWVGDGEMMEGEGKWGIGEGREDWEGRMRVVNRWGLCELENECWGVNGIGG